MGTNTPIHTVRSYETERDHLKSSFVRMAEIADHQIADALDALLRCDRALCRRVQARDAELDSLERELDGFCVRLLALRQPAADDLRLIVAGLKASHDIERIGDYAADAAARALTIAALHPVGDRQHLFLMAEMVRRNLTDAVQALVQTDATKAQRVWLSDVQVDEIYTTVFNDLLKAMANDTRAVAGATHTLFVARSLERIGDHATNIAEMAYYAATGEDLPEARPKADLSASAVV